MIREIEIEGFKSIDRLKMELGRVTVLIGENGCGKSNILEAIAFASAARADKLDHEFLASRGIRTSLDPKLMRPAFPEKRSQGMHVVLISPHGKPVGLQFHESGSATHDWNVTFEDSNDGELSSAQQDILNEIIEKSRTKIEQLDSSSLRAMGRYLMQVSRVRRLPGLAGFLVFSPENSALRTFQREGQILPIGINGEGLFAHLRALDRAGHSAVLDELNRRLSLIDWFSGFEIPTDLGPGEHRLAIRDRFLASDVLLDQRSANEGFLFLLFYYTLLLSPDTPKFFAIDNIDASLNPRLCARLMHDVVDLAKQYDRQVLVTTHNPAVLDGLDLSDDDQRLFVVSRTEIGATRVRRVRAPKPIEGAPPLRLSEAFLRGFLGGLPDNF